MSIITVYHVYCIQIIYYVFQAVQIPSIRARAVIQRESHEEFKGIHYSSTLTVSNLTYQDTGEFGCYYQEQTPDNSASVYVYIYGECMLLVDVIFKYIVPLDMKGCMCHFTPFPSKRTIFFKISQ